MPHQASHLQESAGQQVFIWILILCCSASPVCVQIHIFLPFPEEQGNTKLYRIIDARLLQEISSSMKTLHQRVDQLQRTPTSPSKGGGHCWNHEV